MKRYSQVKVESAQEIERELIKCCLKYCHSPEQQLLLRLGSLLGNLTNDLRAALNYMMATISETKLKPILNPNDYKKLKRNLDFPCSKTKADFDNIQLVKALLANTPNIYTYLEHLQPYHANQEWLLYLIQISNKDKHEVINEVVSPEAQDIAAVTSSGEKVMKPQFMGNKLLISANGRPYAIALPNYFKGYGAFAMENHRWSIFLVTLEDIRLGLIPFSQQAISNIEKTINDMDRFL